MKEIRVPILNDEYKVIVFWGNSVEISKMLKKYHYPDNITNQTTVDNCLRNNRGVCFHYDFCYPLIALPKKPRTAEEIGSFCHEAVHAINFIFNSIGENSKDEVFSHSVGAIVRKTLLIKNKI